MSHRAELLYVLLLLFLALAWLPAWADMPVLPAGPATTDVAIQIDTKPDGALVQIWRGATKVSLGPSGQVLTCPVVTQGDTPVVFMVHLDGYHDVEVPASSKALREATGVVHLPAEGPLYLVPTSAWMPLRTVVSRHPWQTAGLVVLLCVAAGVFAWQVRQRLARAARLAELLPREPDDENVGKSLGRWLITGLLGRGGCASVYAAVPIDTLAQKDRVALKILHTEVVTDAFRARFRREVAICSRLNHPNVVRLLDWGDADVFYMTMELVEGQSLRSLLRGRAMGIKQCLEILGPVCSAVGYAHKEGIFHHDLKPENVMVTPQGRVRVMDFGIATGTAYEKVTQTGDLLGTPGYIAPEQMNGVRDDPRSDQYAVGVMAFEMLCGQQPFPEPDIMVRLSQHAMLAPPKVNAINRDISEAVARVVDRMLAKAPDARYESMQAAWKALEMASGL